MYEHQRRVCFYHVSETEKSETENGVDLLEFLRCE